MGDFLALRQDYDVVIQPEFIQTLNTNLNDKKRPNSIHDLNLYGIESYLLSWINPWKLEMCHFDLKLMASLRRHYPQTYQLISLKKIRYIKKYLYYLLYEFEKIW